MQAEYAYRHSSDLFTVSVHAADLVEISFAYDVFQKHVLQFLTV